MASVTQRIKQIKQPRGGYINPREFMVIPNHDNITLYQDENISPGLIGTAVDYLTRFCAGASPREAFQISLLGAALIHDSDHAENMLRNVSGLDDASIVNACRLSGYDVCYRAGTKGYRSVDGITPDSNTIANIRNMTNRSMRFLSEYGPVIKDGFTFEGGYTDIVNTGDGDFLTATTLWDLKVSKKAPTSSHTLQLLMYYIMGMNSIHKEFNSIKSLGIYNPRLNTVYALEVNKIDSSIIDEVSSKIIGYGTGDLSGFDVFVM